MYKIYPPQITATKAYQTSTESIRDKHKRTAFRACVSEIEASCKEYDLLGEAARFETALPSSFEVPSLDHGGMPELYDKQFSRVKKTEELRDIIKSGAENNLCPYCGIGYTSQLDHYLPKSEFHAVAVHPLNLVPSCADCNKVKSTYFPSLSSPAVFHPYFDKVFDIAWLEAAIVQGHDNHSVAQFGVDSKITDAQLRSRMSRHLEVFDLHNRFSSVASQLIQEFETMLGNSGQKVTLNQAKRHLEMSIQTSTTLRLNDCRAATYRAMLSSPWYLSSFPHLK